jgi:hypothetical protein
MGEIDDLVETRTEQILLTGLTPLLRPHRNPPSQSQEDGITIVDSRESAAHILQGNRNPEPQILQYRLLQDIRSYSAINTLSVLHGRRINFSATDQPPAGRLKFSRPDELGQTVKTPWTPANPGARRFKTEAPLRNQAN